MAHSISSAGSLIFPDIPARLRAQKPLFTPWNWNSDMHGVYVVQLEAMV